MKEKKWKNAEPVSAALRDGFPELHPVTVQLLANRGITTQQEIDEFLLPDYGQDLHDPFIFREMEEACARVWNAATRREKVVIHGDYDADGVTGTAILLSVFREIAQEVGGDSEAFTSYIPHREHEGYGLNMDTVKKLAADGNNLLVTVDCGISNADEIARVKELGMDAIVVDHHQVSEKVPECTIIHPLAPGEKYPFKGLAAAGVAFKFAAAFLDYARRSGVEVPEGREKWLLDLVAIATVTDIMPLLGENRTLEKYGLIVLNKTRRPGLKRLIEAAGLEPGQLDTVSVGYYIGPRINAASRMDHADLALDTVMAKSDEEAQELAQKLNLCNAERQKRTEEMFRKAKKMVDPSKKVQVVVGDGWSAGIVGIVAGKLVTELGMPAFVLCRQKDHIVGSGRSIPEFDVMELLNEASDVLARYGGHPEACGLTIEGDENLNEFIRIAGECAAKKLDGADLRPTLRVECELKTSQVTWELVNELEKFEPFGQSNPKPLFMFHNLMLNSLYPVGKDGKHVRVGVKGDAPKEFKMIGFGMTERMSEFTPGSAIDAVAEVGVNEWNGSKSIQLRLVDVKPSGESGESGEKRGEKVLSRLASDASDPR
ncbi:MAG: single-stranded-DNA-specific exonuclease RecJ [Patescibacteria group bacterium]|nr:single-stranded-DNA-specific exonuclease RecJ [Patescibacteria group bacterium]